MTACGDDGNKTTDGSVTPGIDACVGHACGGGTVAVTDPEGGNLVLEHMKLDKDLQGFFQLPTGVTTQTRIMAYFMSAMTPDMNPLPAPGVCTNLAATKGWPAYVGTPHTDIDVGTLTIKGKNAAGTDVSIEVPKLLAGKDQLNRAHDVYYQFLSPNADALLKPDSFYSVQFGGVTGGMPATTFNDAIYLSADYPAVMSPGLEDDGPLIPGTDFPVAWTPPTPANKPPAANLVGGDILGVTWLIDLSGAPTHVCIVPASVGHFTIPGSAITEYKTVAAARGLPTDKVIMLRNAIAHQLVRLPTTDAGNQRRIDMVTLACWAQIMAVQ